ncbi:MAG: hypothetical protein ACFFDN_51485 [Candidatus Hodarchaeota archaeon]
MVSNREARAMGYVDKIHYKYYAYMSADEYIKKIGGGKDVMNNDKAVCDFGSKTSCRIADMNEELGELITKVENVNVANVINTIDTHFPELHEMIGGAKSFVNLSPEIQEMRENLVRRIENFIKYEQCIKEKFLEPSDSIDIIECFEFIE